jgi:hypothetical protein
LPHRAIPELDEEAAHRPVLVVPVPDANAGALLQGVPGVEGAAQDLVGGGQERDRTGEELLQGPGPTGGREMKQGGT